MDNDLAFVEPSDKLSLAVDHYNRYPGEAANFFLKFIVPEQSGAKIQLRMPQVMNVETYKMPEGVSDLLPLIAQVDDDIVIVINLDENFVPGQEYEIVIQVRITTFYLNQFLIAEANLVDGDLKMLATETVRVAVFGKGKYLKNLPEIYEGDDFVSRFLMMFESFWKPINTQIDQIEHYFDPDLTPEVFIPWLASWMGMPLDDLMPKNRMRKIMKNTMVLFQRRGTLEALQKYLEIFTEGEVVIIERRASNFVLGESNILGLESALGRENQPNTISVNLKIAEEELERTQFTEEIYHKKMNEVIRAMVPAHIVYDVSCEFYT